MQEVYKPIDYTIINQKTAYQGKRLKVEELTYQTGNKVLHREHVIAGEAVVILAITEKQEVIMIEEPRTPIGTIVLDLPAGMIEQGELPEEAAKRELEEETGYQASILKQLREYYPSVGYSNEKITVFLAKGLTKTVQHLGESEDIKVKLIPMQKVITMLQQNLLQTASSNIALFHYLVYENQKKGS